jgi:hypothetical protein
MSHISKKQEARLPELKRYVEQSYSYFYRNYRRFNEFKRFVFKTALTNDDITNLRALMKPNIEFNVLEAFISRLRGQFAEYEPNPKVSAAEGIKLGTMSDKFLLTMKVLEAHFRDVFFEASNDCLSYNIYTDMLAGGYGVMKIYTDYINPMSFEQTIKIKNVFDPTMVGFDPMARDSHKGDGKYCFELMPYSKEDFENKFGKSALKYVNFSKQSALGEFNWSFADGDGKNKTVLVACLYEKQFKKEKIALLSNGRTILKKHYEDMINIIRDSGMLVQPPMIMQERDTTIEKIHQYHFFQDEVIDHVETNFAHLPLIFFDGNSVVLSGNESQGQEFMTRPYVYNAKGIQKLKNFAGQTVAAEIENMKMTQWVISAESIDPRYLDAIQNPQKASSLIYREFFDGDPNVRTTPPREVQRTPTPDIVLQTFMGSDNVTQAILGSYDSQAGNVDNRTLSGKAIEKGTLQSNNAAMPYLVGYMKGLNRACEILLDLIPKYYVTPRSLPIRTPNGQRSYVVINDDSDPQNTLYMDYDPSSLQVKVEAGVNSATQKQIALDHIVRLMGASEIFAQFINTEGLETLLENLDIRGSEELKEKAKQFMDNMRQAQQAQAQQPPIEDKMLAAQTEIEMAKVEQRREEAEGKLATKTAEIAVDELRAMVEFEKARAEIARQERESFTKSMSEEAKLALDATKLSLEVAKERNEAMLQGEGQEKEEV